jgi:hypothetical protein
MLNAMATGNFAIPVFGAAGTAFHLEDEERSEAPTPRKKTPATAKKGKKMKVEEGEEMGGELQTHVPKTKRKRTVKDNGGVEGVQKKPRAVRKKVKADLPQPNA